MPQSLTYLDAVKLLGGSGPLMKVADNVLGGVLSVATAGGSEAAISLFDAKTEAVRLGHLVTDKITDIVRGQARYTRSERLHAAHAVLVVTSFFTALDDCLDATGLENPGFTRDDQILLASAVRFDGSWQSRLLAARIPAPSADLTHDRLMAELVSWFASLSWRLAEHLRGLAVWESAGLRTRGAAEKALREAVPAMSAARYEEAARQLSLDVPEFAVWLSRLDSRAVSRGLEALESTLLRATSGRAPARHRADLALTYRAVLDDPVLGGDTGEVTKLSLGISYLDPRFRVKAAGPGARAADEDWWADAPVRDDFGTFLATYLTTPQAAEAPMLLLGQPGAGKSTLTRVLAARLPAADYLAVRVTLREVRAEAEIQDQIEQALRGAIGETVAWADLARDADAAMPVILLDGFDELLQATGLHQSDYLTRVAAFQQREARLGRPAAVVVTSRVAVADRARLPAGSLAARLEPFDESQVDRWLAIWNDANAAYWARTGLRPLARDVVLRFPDLATQPLLLLMLALYDATGNALQDATDFDTGLLYEQLLHDFAAREVRRVHDGRPDAELPGLVEEELLRLSVVAFAMFHRLRLWVTTEELDADLAGLGLRPSRSGTAADFRSPLSAGQEMVGRFFFIQRAQAWQDDQTRQTYEFLHATFGEYLVARLVVHAVQEAAALSKVRSIRLGQQSQDDELLQNLLGYTPLSARNTILPFVTALLARSGPEDPRDWLIDRLRTAVIRPAWTPRAYQPVDKRADHWMSTYSFNLLLLTLACGQPVRATELYQHARDPAGWLRDMALQWRAAVPGGMFLDALEHLQVEREWAADGRRDMVLRREPTPMWMDVDPRWAFSFGRSWNFPEAASNTDYFPMHTAFRSMDLSSSFSDDAVRHAVEAAFGHLPPQTLVLLVEQEPGHAESVAHTLMSLSMNSGGLAPAPNLLALYDRALKAIDRVRPLFPHLGDDPVLLFLRSLAVDAGRLPSGDVLRLIEHLVTADGQPVGETGVLALSCLSAGRGQPSERYDRFAADLAARLGPADLSVDACLRLLTALPVTRAWRLGPLLAAIDVRLDAGDVLERIDADADFAARLVSARARFDGYRDRTE
ncbi:NACHT domain-containing protein [Actinoplanes flavus]|uniref:ATP-binding protein n=1 Tax=Actinoplanes flavus TaxID=2820290 RepID=A0ABS3UDJ5_9ACTN|nr:ATP-binding protein [Actinoplanes flavus]MBO3736844.1 ATP-binding protein [Actinoplanes flavus]